MFPSTSRLCLIAAAAIALAAPRASAGTILSDNFETGSLSSSDWLIDGHAEIVTDPLNSSNHVLSFSGLDAGGDLWTVPLDLSGDQVTVSFDYLGIQQTPGAGTDTGGFVILDKPNSFSGYVLLGTDTAGSPYYNNMLNLSDGAWHHVSITFDPALFGAGDFSKLTFEQWSSSPNAAGGAFFDNIQVTVSPEPSTVSMLACGLILALLAYLPRKTPLF